MNFVSKNHNKLLLILFFILIGCKLQEPTKSHGILFLENRSNQLVVKKDNKNDVIKLFGSPHSKSFNNDDEWIYIERVLTKGSFHKLGQNVIKSNNVLVLSFNKYGIINQKKFLDQSDLNKLSFSKDITDNDLSKRSFVESFLSSIKSKMYSNR
jgi:outer membrane protein assembly factor BamE (lipoprotein component of BamABCDE complex)|tara:strand:+ start:474 stop:935 length:462 start_codon:yes stop_codon:yes gene_type:complete